METSNNTILITGGGSGIGFETAKLFSQLGNTVIITGRNEDKLKNAVRQLHKAHYITGDVTKDSDLVLVVREIETRFPNLNILINNAGRAVLHLLSNSPRAVDIAREEMETNFFGGLNLTTRLLPVLKKQSSSAVINVSSIVAFAPSLALPTYSASKAALHSYTQALRLSLRETTIKVFEVMPPLVDTEFARDIDSEKKISPQQVGVDIVRGVAVNKYEIRVASTENLYNNFLSQSANAVLALNGLDLN